MDSRWHLLKEAVFRDKVQKIGHRLISQFLLLYILLLLKVLLETLTPGLFLLAETIRI
jgi:hypothetical protein